MSLLLPPKYIELVAGWALPPDQVKTFVERHHGILQESAFAYSCSEVVEKHKEWEDVRSSLVCIKECIVTVRNILGQEISEDSYVVFAFLQSNHKLPVGDPTKDGFNIEAMSGPHVLDCDEQVKAQSVRAKIAEAVGVQAEAISWKVLQEPGQFLGWDSYFSEKLSLIYSSDPEILREEVRARDKELQELYGQT